MSGNHYIYAYFDPRDGTPRYIGQGRGKRVHHWRNDECENLYGFDPWLLKLRSLGLEPVVSVVVDRLTKEQANRWEIDLIDLVGREIDGTGPLKNLSTGGRFGGAGRRIRPESRWRASESNRAAARRKRPGNNLGVTFHRRDGTWRAQTKLVNNRNKHLGYFLTENEAAYAYNVAVRVLFDGEGSLNHVDQLLDVDTRERIDWEVRRRLDRPPRSRKPAGEIKGVHQHGGTWRAEITVGNGHTKHLGTFSTENEAAYAYNVAIILLGSNKSPNPVADLDALTRRHIDSKVQVLLAGEGQILLHRRRRIKP